MNTIQKILTFDDELKSKNIVTSECLSPNCKILSDSKSKSINNRKTTVELNVKYHSAETSFLQLVFKDFIKNMKKMSKNIIFKFTEEDRCISCQKSEDVVEPINYRSNAHYFQVLKAMHKKDKNLKDNLSYNDCIFNFIIFSKERIIFER